MGKTLPSKLSKKKKKLDSNNLKTTISYMLLANKLFSNLHGLFEHLLEMWWWSHTASPPHIILTENCTLRSTAYLPRVF